ncbi:MAG: transporter substrate-binding domain-containing protein [Desulfuromusa sp.]|nr:transporter substrate-binding domain-containing protein [Desulfuromusa sp.]
MKVRFIFIMIFCCFVTSPYVAGVYADSLKETTIHIADDGAEWPPYSYYQRVDGKKTNKIIGFSVDVITEIFKKHGIKFTVELLPWKRTQKNVEKGKTHQMLLSASYSEERAKKYLVSRSYYTLNHVVFYSAKTYPAGLFVKSVDDMKKRYKVCGLFGYSYESLGFDSSEIDQKISSYGQLIKVLHNRPQRCEVFIEGYEIFVGFKAVGIDHLADKDLKYTAIPSMAPKTFHMLISRNFKYAEELKRIIDEGITSLEESGRLNELMKKYNLEP